MSGDLQSAAPMHLRVPLATVRKINRLSKRHYTCEITLLLAKETAETLGTGWDEGKGLAGVLLRASPASHSAGETP